MPYEAMTHKCKKRAAFDIRELAIAHTAYALRRLLLPSFARTYGILPYGVVRMCTSIISNIWVLRLYTDHCALAYSGDRSTYNYVTSLQCY